MSAVDPSESFVFGSRKRATREWSVQRASAEQLPFQEGRVDAPLAQLVVHFMADPVAGLTRDGTSDAAGWFGRGMRLGSRRWGKGPLSLFWQAARELDPGVEDESRLARLSATAHLVELLQAAGLRDVDGDDSVGVRRAPELRRLVGAVHARRRSCRCVREWARASTSGRAARTLSTVFASRRLSPLNTRAWAARGVV